MTSTSERLKYHREIKELDHSDVAYILGIPETDYIAMEQSNADVPLKILVKLSRYYGISLDAFLEVPAKPQSTQPPIDESQVSHQRSMINESRPDKDKQDVKQKLPITGRNLLDDFDLDKPRKPVTAKQAVAILKKNGTEVTEEQAEEVLKFMRVLANISVKHAIKTGEWNARLKREPQGFIIEGKGHSCQICNRSAENGWYDHSGLRCDLCQQAILKSIIPPNICGHNELYYNEYELERGFNLHGKTLTQWIRNGIIKARIIPFADGKGKYYRIFLMKDNDGFLPPKEMLECHDYVVEEKDGQEWQVPLRWYQAQEDPATYLADYGITKYLNFTRAQHETTDTTSSTKGEKSTDE